MSQPEIVNRAEVAAALGISSTISDADSGLIEMLKRLVENEARRYCGHDITRPETAYVRLLPAGTLSPRGVALLEPDGGSAELSHVLQLPHPFVRPEQLEVRVDPGACAGEADGAFGDETLLDAGTDCYLDLDETGLSRSGLLFRAAGSWPSQPRTVRVSYFAGFTSAELDDRFSDIKAAILDEVALRFQQVKSRQAGSGAIVSESIGGEYSVTYDTRAMDQAGLSQGCRDRLFPYVAVIP